MNIIEKVSHLSNGVYNKTTVRYVQGGYATATVGGGLCEVVKVMVGVLLQLI